ncbi:MAG: putative ABC transporter permease [Clostridiaceae bacterium]|nr:putative ABC transporter permease [Clostridiaceae bacterium]
MYDNFYDLVIYFMFYSFSGWLLEVAYAWYKERRFINRGFLLGPLCPVYGFGILLILLISSKFKSNLPLANIVSIMLLTTILEYMTGYILETLFNVKAWDYSNEFCNLKGRICLKFSLAWGLLGYFVIYKLHPIVLQHVKIADEGMKVFMSHILLGGLLADAAIVILSKTGFMKHIKSRVRISIPLHIFKT